MKRVCIVGASAVLEDSFLGEDFFFVAADKGYEVFLKRNREPDLFVGDLDSLGEGKLKDPKKKILLNTRKDDTDTLFAVKTLLEQGYKDFYFYGCAGGKIDHAIGNIQILHYIKEQGGKAYLFDQENQMVLTPLKEESISFPTSVKGRFSLLSLTDESLVTETGFEYELHSYPLVNTIPLGVSNEHMRKENRIQVEKGTVLLIAPISFLF